MLRRLLHQRPGRKPGRLSGRAAQGKVSPQRRRGTERDIAIQYIPGSADASRIPSGGRWILIGLFVASLAALTFVTVRFWKNYQAHERRKARNNAGW